MCGIKPMKTYLYGMFCEVSSDRPSKLPKVAFEWSRECRMAFEDERGYWVPGTAYRLDHEDGYRNWEKTAYDPNDGYGSISVELLTLDPNYMEEFKQKAIETALKELLLRLDELNQKEKKNGARE